MLQNSKKLENALAKKATTKEIASAFSMLASAMATPTSFTELSAEAYILALTGYSSYAVKKMMFDHLKGKTSSKDKRFVPSAPELSAYCYEIEDELIKTVKQLTYYLNLITYSQALREKI